MNWNELDDERELCWLGGEMDVLILLPCRRRALGIIAPF
jgi:hypothetical protein